MTKGSKRLSPWQILVIEQLLEHAKEFGRYEEKSLAALVELWCSADSVTVKVKG